MIDTVLIEKKSNNKQESVLTCNPSHGISSVHSNITDGIQILSVWNGNEWTESFKVNSDNSLTPVDTNYNRDFINDELIETKGQQTNRYRFIRYISNL